MMHGFYRLRKNAGFMHKREGHEFHSCRKAWRMSPASAAEERSLSGGKTFLRNLPCAMTTFFPTHLGLSTLLCISPSIAAAQAVSPADDVSKAVSNYVQTEM